MVQDQDVIHINVTICDRPYRLKIKPQEEEAVRSAAREISEHVKDLQGQFAGKDKQDYLAMYALTLAVGSQTNENRLSGLQDTILEALTDLDDHLQKSLQQHS
ncbi:MAG TPA: cell division protein ZapA [Bacteroidetes bacterium]|nr:cell division protein ZapA [Bacteroidota bacterium]HAE34612.1 cell division protein ZapA [Bacteroidota bacterium]